MLKKTLTYSDLDGNPVTEDFYFNLNKPEIAEMELSMPGGWSAWLESIIESQDGGEIIKAFKWFITETVGRRSEDGRRFVKNQEIIDDFLETNAYEQLFMELITDANAAAQFVVGVMPADMQGDPKIKEIKAQALQSPEQAKDERPAWVRENREPTKKELQSMSADELREAFRNKGK